MQAWSAFRIFHPGIHKVFHHSLAAVREKLPDVLRVTAEAEDGEIMAVEHTEYPIFGVQFHPESVMTPDGKVMVENFMNNRVKNSKC